MQECTLSLALSLGSAYLRTCVKNKIRSLVKRFGHVANRMQSNVGPWSGPRHSEFRYLGIATFGISELLLRYQSRAPLAILLFAVCSTRSEVHTLAARARSTDLKGFKREGYLHTYIYTHIYMARFIVRPSNPALWWSSTSTPTPTARIITSQTVQTAQTATAVTRLRHVCCVSSCFLPSFPPVFPYYSSCTLSHSILLLCEQSRALCASCFFSSLLSRPLLIFLPTRPRAPCSPPPVRLSRYREDSRTPRETACRLLPSPARIATITSSLVAGAAHRRRRCARFVLFWIVSLHLRAVSPACA